MLTIGRSSPEALTSASSPIDSPTSVAKDAPVSGAARFPWPAIVLGLLIVFLFSEHNPRVSTQVAFTQNAEEMIATAAGGNTVRRLCYMALATLGAIGWLVASGARWKTPGLLTVLATGGVAICFASVLWTDDPSITVRRLMVLAFFVVGALGVARALDFRDLCRVILAFTLVTVSLGILAEIGCRTFRPWSGEYRFSGTLHPNTQGAYLAALCVSALCLALVEPRRRWLYAGMIFFGLTMLYLTKSRTSFAGVVVTLAMTVLVHLPGRWKFIAPVACAWVAALGLTGILLFDAEGDKKLSKLAMMGREEESEGFTGRTTIWPAVTPFIAKRPWLGYGYEGFWTQDHIDHVSRECEWGVREAHNSYLDAMLMCGAVGLFFYIATPLIAIASSLGAHARGRDPCVLFWFGFTLNGMFNGLLESGMAMIGFPTFCVLVGVCRLSLFESADKATADVRDRVAPDPIAWTSAAIARLQSLGDKTPNRAPSANAPIQASPKRLAPLSATGVIDVARRPAKERPA